MQRRGRGRAAYLHKHSERLPAAQRERVPAGFVVHEMLAQLAAQTKLLGGMKDV